MRNTLSKYQWKHQKIVNESNLSVLIVEFGKVVAYLYWNFFPK